MTTSHYTTYRFRGTIPPGQLKSLCNSTYMRSDTPATIDGVWIPEGSLLISVTTDYDDEYSNYPTTTIEVNAPNLACCCLDCLAVDEKPPKTDAGSPIMIDPITQTSDWPRLCEGLYYISPNSEGSL